jgi:hypothetical protein
MARFTVHRGKRYRATIALGPDATAEMPAQIAEVTEIA